MSYQSIDTIQKALGEEVFSHTKDRKKAAGRALGTIVELVTFYLLKTWKFEDSVSIEFALKEYGNGDIAHRVEYTMHPILRKFTCSIPYKGGAISAKHVFNLLKSENSDIELSSYHEKLGLKIIDKNDNIRNCCTIAVSKNQHINCIVKSFTEGNLVVDVLVHSSSPYSMFECKRVGVEDGNKKGPQTIEKAKQGAYVARTASSLQRLIKPNGELYGVVYKPNDSNPIIKPYYELLNDIINSADIELLSDFILTVGVISNHGNWFTAENQNKELKVLAKSYNWLLFLTDNGLSRFIEETILHPLDERYTPIRKAFLDSYSEGKKENIFTKVKIDINADYAMQLYFRENIDEIEKWFNIIEPQQKSINDLKSDLLKIKKKISI